MQSKTIEQSKGATKPNVSAAHWPIIPARIATIELQKYACAKVLPSRLGSKERPKCSLTIQASKTENSKEVATPPNSLPSISTWKLEKCLVMQDAT
mmetsp:Transcript_14753/g.36035  ORF Transcript_14753/g.36035 Transcript_14753/m.36035 type:complete len:96 (+) Transcript_14753:927-1214(+)